MISQTISKNIPFDSSQFLSFVSIKGRIKSAIYVLLYFQGMVGKLEISINSLYSIILPTCSQRLYHLPNHPPIPKYLSRLKNRYCKYFSKPLFFCFGFDNTTADNLPRQHFQNIFYNSLCRSVNECFLHFKSIYFLHK